MFSNIFGRKFAYLFSLWCLWMSTFVFMKSRLSVLLGGGDDGRLGLLCKAHKISPVSIFANPQGPKDIMVSSWSFIVLVLEVGSLSPVDFCLWCEVGNQDLFSMWTFSCSTHLLKRPFFFHLNCSRAFVENEWSYVWAVSGLSSDPLGLFINSSIHPTLS